MLIDSEKLKENIKKVIEEIKKRTFQTIQK